ncbi:MAG: glycosyltransferase family 4 protein [Chloroflexi bacterium]|nr:glycosyltransferase family 4 protein [Chloroflexota bacterium]
MRTLFDVDPYPGRPRILFIGLSHSTHTHSWIDLLDGSELNVRLFALPTGVPPENWKVRTYVTAYTPLKLDPGTRAKLYHLGRVEWLYKQGLARLFFDNRTEFEEKWLARVIRRWRPDVIHTLGLDPAGYFYLRVRNRFGLTGIGKWVLQLRGGSDLTLSRLDPEASTRIGQILRACDQLISDNEQNFRFALEMGIREEQISPLGTVPGTGGVDVASLAQSWHGPPSSRRVILWPKAYDCPWSMALPVFEAIKLSWDRIKPCQIYMLAMIPETRMWYWALPEHIRQSCHVADRIPRDKVLELAVQARVMLAPSLVDGTPNSMFEAMAAGAFPIVSPLESIRPLVEDERNVLFARNLYPYEIAGALCRAMSDDALVDSAAERNLGLVRRIADRSKIRPRVIEYYKRLAEEQASSG